MTVYPAFCVGPYFTECVYVLSCSILVNCFSFIICILSECIVFIIVFRRCNTNLSSGNQKCSDADGSMCEGRYDKTAGDQFARFSNNLMIFAKCIISSE